MHSSRGRKDISSLAHKPGSVNLCTSRDDFGFSDTLLLGGRRERSGYLCAENDILDEDALDGHAPLVGDISNNFSDFESDCFTLSDDTLDGPCADDVAESCLGTLGESLTEVADTKSSTVWVGDLEIDDGVAKEV